MSRNRRQQQDEGAAGGGTAVLDRPPVDAAQSPYGDFAGHVNDSADVLGDESASADSGPSTPICVRNPVSPGIIGWPVQYCEKDGTIIPGVLHRRPITSPDTWDVKVFLGGAATFITRGAIRMSPISPAPTPGCWNYLPGLEPKPG